jgi:c-di-GMP-binding flagellar brake protein YcgR
MSLRKFLNKGYEVKITDPTGQMVMATVEAVNDYEKTVACRARASASFLTGFKQGAILKIEFADDTCIREITGRLQWTDDILSYFSLSIIGQPRSYQRRKFFRVENPPVDAVIGINPGNGSPKALQPKVKNLSGNGIALMLNSKSPIKIGDRIQASICLDGVHVVQAQGEVVRRYASGMESEDVAAVHLHGLSTKDTDTLVRFLLGLQAQRRRYQPEAA